MELSTLETSQTLLKVATQVANAIDACDAGIAEAEKYPAPNKELVQKTLREIREILKGD
jgi:hypothetical protein